MDVPVQRHLGRDQDRALMNDAGDTKPPASIALDDLPTLGN